jgi:CubicO group peptidase (beta-lactamase class C family)
MAYEVLGDLVAKVSGETFEGYVEANILKPLGMNSSTLLYKKADPAMLADGHTRAKDGSVRPIAHYPYNRAHTPSSNLHSNVVDMVRWAAANLNRGELGGHRVLKNATYGLMWKPVAVSDGKVSVGISWFLKESIPFSRTKGRTMVMHSGGDDGFLTKIMLLPAEKRGVILMTNYDYGPALKVWETEIVKMLDWE